MVYDGHQPEYPGDFTSVEQTVDAVISYLKSCGISQLDGVYGCSMGGACLTRMLALGEMPIGRAIIDGGITPYQMPVIERSNIAFLFIRITFFIICSAKDRAYFLFPFVL